MLCDVSTARAVAVIACTFGNLSPVICCPFSTRVRPRSALGRAAFTVTRTAGKRLVSMCMIESGAAARALPAPKPAIAHATTTPPKR
jgi:hypothetical protein